MEENTMDNKNEIRKLISERMIRDPFVDSTVKMLAKAYINELNKDEDYLESILTKHFDELILWLLKVHFKAYDDVKCLLTKTIQEGPPPNIIITTEEHYNSILKENNHCTKIKEEVNRYDIIEKENKELYKKLKAENKW